MNFRLKKVISIFVFVSLWRALPFHTASLTIACILFFKILYRKIERSILENSWKILKYPSFRAGFLWKFSKLSFLHPSRTFEVLLIEIFLILRKNLHNSFKEVGNFFFVFSPFRCKSTLLFYLHIDDEGDGDVRVSSKSSYIYQVYIRTFFFANQTSIKPVLISSSFFSSALMI